MEREKIKVTAKQDIELGGKVQFEKGEEFEVRKFFDYFYFRGYQINAEWIE